MVAAGEKRDIESEPWRSTALDRGEGSAGAAATGQTSPVKVHDELLSTWSQQAMRAPAGVTMHMQTSKA